MLDEPYLLYALIIACELGCWVVLLGAGHLSATTSSYGGGALRPVSSRWSWWKHL